MAASNLTPWAIAALALLSVSCPYRKLTSSRSKSEGGGSGLWMGSKRLTHNHQKGAER